MLGVNKTKQHLPALNSHAAIDKQNNTQWQQKKVKVKDKNDVDARMEDHEEDNTFCTNNKIQCKKTNTSKEIRSW